MVEHAVVLLALTLVVIALAAAIAPRLGIPAQLILMVAGIGVSLIPAVPDVVIDPQWILLGLLPPLLYASATAISATNFRRDFRAIGGLSVVLVVLSSLALGGLFSWLIPGLAFGWGVALGAILSPTDAVATSIIRGRGVPGRVLVILDGESLLNDASALVVLRTAVVALAVGFSFWQTLASFAYAVGVAIAAGTLAAVLNIAIRRRVHEEAVNTILSFATPFAAAVPAELLHGSGLVAAVVAGLVAGIRSPRQLPPGHRMSDAQNWATVQLVLEGLVFLTMGLQLSSIFKQVAGEQIGVGSAFAIALLALGVTLLVRTAYVAPLLWGLHRNSRVWHARQPSVMAMKQEVDAGRVPDVLANRPGPLRVGSSERTLRRLATRLRRGLADMDYLSRQPLGLSEGALVIWAGMRGAVTVAAAQLLPASTPHRSLLIFIAFLVAMLSLVLQGGTVGLLVARLFPAADKDALGRERDRQEHDRIRTLLQEATGSVQRTEQCTDTSYHLDVLVAQRVALLDARDDGVVDAESLRVALLNVDVDELVLRLRGRLPGEEAA